MLIYRFRVTSADHEDFIREIEIQPTQTFLDFHEIIISCSDLDSCQNAVFFTTDKKYKPHSEITLKPQKKQIKKYDQELDEIVTISDPTPLMEKSQLKSFIEDPHQKMIYEFSGKDLQVFNIELFKITKSEETYLLPRCTKKVGELPKRVDITVEKITEPTIHKHIEKEIIPRIPDPIALEGIHEDESELAEIESNLDEFLDLAIDDLVEESENGSPSSEVAHEDEDSFTLDEDDRMESLEDYDDIEKLEMKHRNFDRDSDDY